jgi:DNA-directed RNA polymerase subunit N (RpoN/RPB10)
MLIPVRCQTCGKVLGDKWRWFQRKSSEAEGESDADKSSKRAGLLDELGLKRMCCRRHMLTTVDVMDKI